MNYTSLKANVEEICEQSFTADQHALFAQQAEQKIYNSVQFPALRKSDDGPYELEHVYGFYPTSIVSAATTWLGDNFDTALLNGTLLEAIRFMKGEADMIALYEKHYLQSITLLKQLSDGKLRQDSYRSGQPKTTVG